MNKHDHTYDAALFESEVPSVFRVVLYLGVLGESGSIYAETSDSVNVIAGTYTMPMCTRQNTELQCSLGTQI